MVFTIKKKKKKEIFKSDYPWASSFFLARLNGIPSPFKPAPVHLLVLSTQNIYMMENFKNR